ncbi:hypothetical protein AVEN_105654-1 [Araneus ventricosus]|uniref:Uncharacterized protein n=1 Tax=Araneus ventricosus TaxID=182803 RepID=A0A4Y2QWM9_ARAVE|nr:hypothetical protein AVEN_105654-1 [Araneus ventricosus]
MFSSFLFPMLSIPPVKGVLPHEPGLQSSFYDACVDCFAYHKQAITQPALASGSMNQHRPLTSSGTVASQISKKLLGKVTISLSIGCPRKHLRFT